MGFSESIFTSLEQSELPIFVIDAEARSVFRSSGLKTLLCGSDPKTAQDFWPAYASLPTGIWSGTAEFLTSDENTIPVHLVSYPMLDSAIFFVLGAAVPEEEATPTARAQSERLETLGMLASGIAHDFNNVLTGILGHVSYLKTVLPQKGDHCESISAIEEGARKAASMTQQILNFSKVNVDEKAVPIDLCSVVQSTVKLLRGAMPIGCILDCAVPDENLQMLAPEGRIAQILINLVVNARDAVTIDGKIAVQLNATDEAEELHEAFGGSDLSSHTYARLVVIDNGHGITQDVKDKMFEPYFSTKKALGTGLGLATVHQTVKQFGGAITVDSKVGVGTRIAVYLPLLRRTDPAESTGTYHNEVVGGRERILIVDDEYPVRNVLSISLQHLGYDVDSADSGAEALDKYEKSAQRFDLVILDMIMPNLAGDRVFARLKEIDPSVRVLVISGYSSEAAVQSILDGGGLDFMQKPFTIEELSRKVRECLAVEVA